MRTIVVARYLGGWGLIVFFIALLTLIFSFLGTILCGVLAGMMFGAVRSAWWKTLAVSVVFPGVLLGVLRTSKTELPPSQVLLLAALCFGTFWGTYWLACALFAYERKGQDGATRRARGAPAARPALIPAATPRVATTIVPTEHRAPSGGLNLAMLQGKWSCRNGPGGESREKVMNIEEEKLTVRVGDATGQVSTLGTAEIRLCNAGDVRTLLVSVSDAASANDTLVSI